MTGQQTAVLWLGVSLIIVRLFTTKQWSQIWGSISPPSAPSSGVQKSGPGKGCPKGYMKVNGKCLQIEAAYRGQPGTATVQSI